MPSTSGDTQLILECTGLRHRPCMHFLLCSAFHRKGHLIPQSSLSAPADLSTFSECGNLSSPSASRQDCWPLFWFLFFFSCFGPTQLLGNFSYPFTCPESSTNVQKMLCENCSICRCILDVIVRRDKFWVLLFCHLDFSLKIVFFNEFCF